MEVDVAEAEQADPVPVVRQLLRDDPIAEWEENIDDQTSSFSQRCHIDHQVLLGLSRHTVVVIIIYCNAELDQSDREQATDVIVNAYCVFTIWLHFKDPPQSQKNIDQEHVEEEGARDILILTPLIDLSLNIWNVTSDF